MLRLISPFVGGVNAHCQELGYAVLVGQPLCGRARALDTNTELVASQAGVTDAFLRPGRGDHHAALAGFYVAVAGVPAEGLEGAVDFGEAFAAFNGVFPVGGGGHEGYEREKREEGECDGGSHGCGCVVMVSERLDGSEERRRSVWAGKSRRQGLHEGSLEEQRPPYLL